MRKQYSILVLLLLGVCSMAQKPLKQTPIQLSVADILANYGIDTSVVKDTSSATTFLNSQTQDYAALSNYCVDIRLKLQNAIVSIENDYRNDGGLIWIDSSTVITDYNIYSVRLHNMIDFMGKQSIRYSRLEEQRLEAEKEATRQRAISEAKKRQDALNQEADELRASISSRHRTIITSCDGEGISDRSKLKELKDLYYSYLMVYNKYDLSKGDATPEWNSQLRELLDFQRDLSDKMLGNNSLPLQIDNFKNALKMQCEKENTDVYRSYIRVFKSTSIPISFADIDEYNEYVNNLKDIQTVQKRYIEVIDLRTKINTESESITNLYGKKYKDLANAYKETAATLNTIPAFTTVAESENFVFNLHSFIEAQRSYRAQYVTHESISARSAYILQSKTDPFSDIQSAYRDAEAFLSPLPSFKDTVGAQAYEQQLQNVLSVQECYLKAISLRKTIDSLDNILSQNKKNDKKITTTYKTIYRQTNLKPHFYTIDQGEEFTHHLNDFISLQQDCMKCVTTSSAIQSNDKTITEKGERLRHLIKAYVRMQKAILTMKEIATREEIDFYQRELNEMLFVQEAFIQAINSDDSSAINNRLKGETDPNKIKLVLGLKVD